MTAETGTTDRGLPLYRALHSAPMLAGVPAHYALLLVGVGAVVGFAVLAVNKTLGLLVVAGVVGVWALLAFVFAQDRVQVPLFGLMLLHRFPKRITSFSPSGQRVRIE